MTRKLFIRIAYDGTDFHGWQRQGSLRTVQGVLEDAFRRVCRHPLVLVGSGRTDAGVHARGQVASLETTCILPVDKIRYAAGERLPDDVTLLDICEAHPQFHATRSATSKLYRYRIHNAPRKPVAAMTHRHVYHYWRPLDVARMQGGARRFVGEHDFASMASTSTQQRETTVRTVIRCDVERRGDEVWVSIEGTGFLYNQVRNMVGTLIEVGRGRWDPVHVQEILASRDRGRGGPCIPPTGLCLMWVRYPREMLAVSGQQSAVGRNEEQEPDHEPPKDLTSPDSSLTPVDG